MRLSGTGARGVRLSSLPQSTYCTAKGSSRSCKWSMIHAAKGRINVNGPGSVGPLSTLYDCGERPRQRSTVLFPWRRQPTVGSKANVARPPARFENRSTDAVSHQVNRVSCGVSQLQGRIGHGTLCCTQHRTEDSRRHGSPFKTSCQSAHQWLSLYPSTRRCAAALSSERQPSHRARLPPQVL